jgi:hypothetical protein
MESGKLSLTMVLNYGQWKDQVIDDDSKVSSMRNSYNLKNLKSDIICPQNHVHPTRKVTLGVQLEVTLRVRFLLLLYMP